MDLVRFFIGRLANLNGILAWNASACTRAGAWPAGNGPKETSSCRALTVFIATLHRPFAEKYIEFTKANCRRRQHQYRPGRGDEENPDGGRNGDWI